MTKNLNEEIDNHAEVVTIYFCGTGITSAWKDGHNNRFTLPGHDSPELVSSLFDIQLTENVESSHKHHKIIINGVGTGEVIPFADLFSTISAASFPPFRGWIVCLREANDYLEDVIRTTKNQVILNIIGHSRGGILAMWFARLAATKDRVNAINIIAYDPVPGEAMKGSIFNLFDWPSYLLHEIANPGIYFGWNDNDIYMLNTKVKHFVGIYATDERSMRFEPIIPIAENKDETKMLILRVRGSHETLVGNNQKDGHSQGINVNVPYPWQTPEEYLPASEWVCCATAAITQELLTSEAWGRVKFSKEYRDSNADARKENFLRWFRQMNDIKKNDKNDVDFKYMRKVSFLPINPNFLLNPWLSTLSVYLEGKGDYNCLRSEVDNNVFFDKYARCAATYDRQSKQVIFVDLEKTIPDKSGNEVWDELVNMLGI